jgi:hypothetical protein
MWFLHVAAFYYILEMERMEAVYTVNETALTEWNAAHGPDVLSPGVHPMDISYGSLNDPIEADWGFQAVDMGTLDKVSALLPVTWFFATIITDDLQLWTKAITANCLLAVGKGVFGILTIVPDSSGWQNCKKREKPEGLARIKGEFADPKEGFGAVFWSGLNFELVIVGGKLVGKKGVRFCADMMYSGHTYFTTLYALGLVELTRMHTRHMSNAVQMGALAVVTLLCLAEQVTEIRLVLINRFHYSMDVAMAIILTFLVYTNGSIAIFSKWWYNWKPGKEEEDEAIHAERLETIPNEVHDWLAKNGKEWALVPKEEVRSDGDLWTPMCCLPFCMFHGRMHLVPDKVLNTYEGQAPAQDHGSEDDGL